MFVKLPCIVPVHTGGALSVDCAGSPFGHLFRIFVKHSYVVSNVEFLWKHNLSAVREWKLFGEPSLDCLRGTHFL